MTALVIVSILAALFFSIAMFFSVEYYKKFKLMDQFAWNSGKLLTYHYRGNREHNIEKGMHNIVISWDRPFSALVGFKLTVPLLGSGLDYYGYARSRKENGRHMVVVSTYLGSGACEFMFLLDKDVVGMRPTVYTCIENGHAAQLHPTVVYPPHWYQKLGFYG